MGSPGLNEQSLYIIPDKRRSSTFFIQSRWRDCSLVSGLILYSRIELITTSSEFLKVVFYFIPPLLRIRNSLWGGLFSFFRKNVVYGKDQNVGRRFLNFFPNKKNCHQKYDDFQDRVPGILFGN